MRLALVVALAAFLAAGVSACGEKSQVTVYKQGKYQGKPDGRPWDNDPPIAELRGGKWDKGDRASWDKEINNRALTQNEYQRIGR